MIRLKELKVLAKKPGTPLKSCMRKEFLRVYHQQYRNLTYTKLLILPDFSWEKVSRFGIAYTPMILLRKQISFLKSVRKTTSL